MRHRVVPADWSQLAEVAGCWAYRLREQAQASISQSLREPVCICLCLLWRKPGCRTARSASVASCSAPLPWLSASPLPQDLHRGHVTYLARLCLCVCVCNGGDNLLLKDSPMHSCWKMKIQVQLCDVSVLSFLCLSNCSGRGSVCLRVSLCSCERRAVRLLSPWLLLWGLLLCYGDEAVSVL